MNRSFAPAFLCHLLPLCTVIFAQLSIPRFPVANIDPSISVNRVANQNHWSEVVTLPRKRYATVDTDNAAQIDCPPRSAALVNWTSASIWSDRKVSIANGLPITTLLPNKNVIIRSNSLDKSNASYGIIKIPASSSLIFDDDTIILRTLGIKVEGSLKLGSSTCRLKSTPTIVLSGTAPAAMTKQDQSIKGIHVTGSLDVHGMVFAPTWTRLAETAPVGATIIYVQDILIGQSIAIMSTALKDALDYTETEVRTISTVWRAPNLGPNICAILLSSALVYKHYGGKEYQAEVALLPRRITIKN